MSLTVERTSNLLAILDAFLGQRESICRVVFTDESGARTIVGRFPSESEAMVAVQRLQAQIDEHGPSSVLDKGHRATFAMEYRRRNGQPAG